MVQEVPPRYVLQKGFTLIAGSDVRNLFCLLGPIKSANYRVNFNNFVRYKKKSVLVS
jgi:hypothetical protein